MKLYEYQAKQMMAGYDIPVPAGDIATTPSDARDIASRLSNTVMIKAQILAGGRGKGGGIVAASDAEEAFKEAGRILGMKLITPQTGPEGRVVRRVLVEKGVKIKNEMYLGVTVDREICKPVVMVSDAGGVDIEETAASQPERIHTIKVDPAFGLREFQARQLAYSLNMDKAHIRKLTRVIMAMYRLFDVEDCSLLEVNPFVITADGEPLALDARIILDDNGLFRHLDYKDLKNQEEGDPLEREANKSGLSYIKLNGNIGCMVNGAGLAMATMDIIKLFGGEPANFLDVGGGATESTIAEGMKIILREPRVKAVLVNIFGGIVRCDRVARGIVEASKELDIKTPLVFRLEGTNVEDVPQILSGSNLNFSMADNLGKAAEMAVGMVKE